MTFETLPPLRPATPADIPAIAALTRRAYAPWVEVIGREPRPMRVDYEAAFRAHRFDLLDGPDGAPLALIETEALADSLYVVNVAVDPAAHGRGIGRRLLARAEGLARAAGLPAMRLSTNEKMARNIAIYRQAGYRIEHREAVPEGGVRVSMVKPLGDRHVVFLPGAGASPTFWRPLGDRLPRTFARTYLAWPGLGEQAPSPEVNGWDDLLGLVEEAVGEGPPADLVAQSMGGYIALAFALRRPGRVRRLVLTATSGGIDTRALGASNWRVSNREWAPDAPAWLDEPVADLTGRIPSLNHPALLIWGDADPISPLAVGRALAGLLPNGSLRVVERGDHDLAVTFAGALAPGIAEFLT